MSNQDDLNTASAPEGSGTWKFDEGVASVFTDMISRSIPGYKTMREVNLRLASETIRAFERRSDYSVQRIGSLLDLGAANGEGAAPILEKFPDMDAILLDQSPAMVSELKQRFSGNERVLADELDLRMHHQAFADTILLMRRSRDIRVPILALATLTLIFLPINRRANVIRGVYESLAPGGTFLLTEKILGTDYEIDNLLVDTYHQLKADHGYSWEAIERKRLSLEHAQTPVTHDQNMTDLRNAGFGHVGIVWQCLNFATYLAIK